MRRCWCGSVGKPIPSYRPPLVGVSLGSPRYQPRGRFHGTAVWQKARARYLRANPLCVRCERQGVTEAATVVHHRVDVRDRPDLALSEDNFESLCKAHHDAETSRRVNAARSGF